MSQRRLDAEAIRDAMLSVSGRLELKAPQGSNAGAIPRKGGGKKAAPAPRESYHRSVYLGIPGGAPLHEVLSVFDVANPNLSVSQREVTTVPAQALFLMNSPFVLEQAKSMAQRLLGDDKMDDAGRVGRAYQMAFARPPTDAERERAVGYIRKTLESMSKEKNAPLSAWASFCQALLASAEFRYVE
jgi:hypothetical protein